MKKRKTLEPKAKLDISLVSEETAYAFETIADVLPYGLTCSLIEALEEQWPNVVEEAQPKLIAFLRELRKGEHSNGVLYPALRKQVVAKGYNPPPAIAKAIDIALKQYDKP